MSVFVLGAGFTVQLQTSFGIKTLQDTMPEGILLDFDRLKSAFYHTNWMFIQISITKAIGITTYPSALSQGDKDPYGDGPHIAIPAAFIWKHGSKHSTECKKASYQVY